MSIKNEPPLIFESPDKGKTVYSRHAGDTDKELVYTEDKESGLTLHDLNEIIRMSKTNVALKDLLDQLKVVYNLSKTHKKKEDRSWEPTLDLDDIDNYDDE